MYLSGLTRNVQGSSRQRDMIETQIYRYKYCRDRASLTSNQNYCFPVAQSISFALLSSDHFLRLPFAFALPSDFFLPPSLPPLPFAQPLHPFPSLQYFLEKLLRLFFSSVISRSFRIRSSSAHAISFAFRFSSACGAASCARCFSYGLCLTLLLLPFHHLLHLAVSRAQCISCTFPASSSRFVTVCAQCFSCAFRISSCRFDVSSYFAASFRFAASCARFYLLCLLLIVCSFHHLRRLALFLLSFRGLPCLSISLFVGLLCLTYHLICLLLFLSRFPRLRCSLSLPCFLLVFRPFRCGSTDNWQYSESNPARKKVCRADRANVAEGVIRPISIVGEIGGGRERAGVSWRLG